MASRFSASAETVWNPAAMFTGIVEIEHAGNGIHTQPVYVILVQPEKGTGDEEFANFVSAEIEDQGAPLDMLALPGVGVLEQSCAVEKSQAVGVFLEKWPGTQSTITPMPALWKASTKIHEIPAEGRSAR